MRCRVAMCTHARTPRTRIRRRANALDGRTRLRPAPSHHRPTPPCSSPYVACAQMGITAGAPPKRNRLDKEKEELIALRLQLERCKAESELLHHQVRRRAPVKS